MKKRNGRFFGRFAGSVFGRRLLELQQLFDCGRISAEQRLHLIFVAGLEDYRLVTGKGYEEILCDVLEVHHG